ncbi:uncharacterized protein DDB_G0279979-like [Centruroides vittatus]|uniref:uncharacterized protein DDB_G0279979-like n=1 Tax=Centruroides vittatus TaxID=120091 RepID=UPI00350F966D
MSPLTRASSKQIQMPCCDLDVDGVERESAMLTALFDPTEWPPLLSLMDSSNGNTTTSITTTVTTTTTTTNSNSAITSSGAEKRKQTESAIENWCKRPKIETDLTVSGEEVVKKKKGKKKDERRKLLKISVNKLRNIDDAETFLRRSVLIHNTVRRLQREMEQERSGDPWEDEEPYGVSENVLQITIGESKCDTRPQSQQTDCAGSQCATQYRTTQGNGHQGESVFDSVVYHSLLVSLES